MAQWSDFISRTSGAGYNVKGLKRGEEVFDAGTGTFVSKAIEVTGFFPAKTESAAVDAAIRDGYVKGTIEATEVKPQVVAIPTDIFNALSTVIAQTDDRGVRIYSATPNSVNESYDELRMVLDEVLTSTKFSTNAF